MQGHLKADICRRNHLELEDFTVEGLPLRGSKFELSHRLKKPNKCSVSLDGGS